jgi:hypothetical protein
MPVLDEQDLHGTYQGITFDATASMTLAKVPAPNSSPADAPPQPQISSVEQTAAIVSPKPESARRSARKR